MKLTRVYSRHYKSFNYDYERKANSNKPAPEWEMLDGQWFPFVVVPIDHQITSIVGSNESGKSQLLGAIEFLLEDGEYNSRDFCRYSTLFSVEQGQRRLPDFAGLFSLSPDEAEELKKLKLNVRDDNTILLWKKGNSDWLVVERDNSYAKIDKKFVGRVKALLPKTFRLATNIPVPDLITFDELIDGSDSLSRDQRNQILNIVSNSKSVEELQAAAGQIFTAKSLKRARPDSAKSLSMEDLGRDLLFKIAKIDKSTFTELQAAIRDGHEGHVNGLIQKINDTLEKNLNLSKWWRQDPDFILKVSPRERELVFTISDKTGTDYSFNERSTGLRYFLSYLIQLRSYAKELTGNEILLMDEPDTYLSAVGQQDLLRILEDYVDQDREQKRRQVVYVTHSPFLINKNASQRIRVLDKGKGDEGTRVIKDATRNRYEPLRSSIGAFIAETAFIGGANLFVEGLSDQIYLVGISSFLRRKGLPESDLIDLNDITIVPSGSASSIPYMLYLARGQDEIKPPCVVLLDSDESGNEARKQIKKGGVHKRPLISDNFVISIGNVVSRSKINNVYEIDVRDLEDLIPIEVAMKAAQAYASNFLNVSGSSLKNFTDEEVLLKVESKNNSLFDGLAEAFYNSCGHSLEKIGFSKEVIKLLDSNELYDMKSFEIFENNFISLISSLSLKLHQSVREEEDKRLNNRLSRAINGFLKDFSESPTKDRANLTLKDIEEVSGDSDAGDKIKLRISNIRRKYNIMTDTKMAIQQYIDFREDLRSILYASRSDDENEI